MKTFKQHNLSQIPSIKFFAGKFQEGEDYSWLDEDTLKPEISSVKPIHFIPSPEEDRVIKTLTPIHDSYFKSLPQEDQEHLIEYTRYSKILNRCLFNGSELSNNHKKQYDSLCNSIAGVTLPEKTTLYSGLHRSPEQYFKTPRPISRNIKGEDMNHQLIHMHLPAFTSTSVSLNAASIFGRKIINSQYIRKHQNELASPEEVRQVQKREFLYKKKRDNVPISDDEEKEYHELRSKTSHLRPINHVLAIHTAPGTHGIYIEPNTHNGGEHEVILHPHCQIIVSHPPELHTNSAFYFHMLWHANLIHDGIQAHKMPLFPVRKK